MSWNGLAYENLCFNHIKQIKAALGISGVSTEESLWSKKGTEDAEGAQIDLIIERKDNDGFSYICARHVGRNKHHWQYWVDYTNHDIIVNVNRTTRRYTT